MKKKIQRLVNFYHSSLISAWNAFGLIDLVGGVSDMFTKMLEMFVKWTYGKKLMGYVDAANEKMSGHRTEILTGLIALVFALEKTGVAPEGTFAAMSPFLLGAMPVTFAEKVKKALRMADKVLPK